MTVAPISIISSLKIFFCALELKVEFLILSHESQKGSISLHVMSQVRPLLVALLSSSNLGPISHQEELEKEFSHFRSRKAYHPRNSMCTRFHFKIATPPPLVFVIEIEVRKNNLLTLFISAYNQRGL
jgi:hypothetical protein